MWGCMNRVVKGPGNVNGGSSRSKWKLLGRGRSRVLRCLRRLQGVCPGLRYCLPACIGSSCRKPTCCRRRTEDFQAPHSHNPVAEMGPRCKDRPGVNKNQDSSELPATVKRSGGTALPTTAFFSGILCCTRFRDQGWGIWAQWTGNWEHATATTEFRIQSTRLETIDGRNGTGADRRSIVQQSTSDVPRTNEMVVVCVLDGSIGLMSDLTWLCSRSVYPIAKPGSTLLALVFISSKVTSSQRTISIG